MLLPFAVAACASHASSGASMGASTAAPPSAERDAVVAAAQSLFDGMRTRDTARLRALVAPHVSFVATQIDSAGRPHVSSQRIGDFLVRVAAGGEELRERMWEPVVHIDGAIATLWAPYDFHMGARFSHCGHDAFHLARTESGWIITAVAFTVQPKGCAPSPLGG